MWGVLYVTKFSYVQTSHEQLRLARQSEKTIDIKKWAKKSYCVKAVTVK